MSARGRVPSLTRASFCLIAETISTIDFDSLAAEDNESSPISLTRWRALIPDSIASDSSKLAEPQTKVVRNA